MSKPDSPCLDKSLFEVKRISLIEARNFIEKHHYAKGGSNTAVGTFGLFLKGELSLLGVAWFIPPTKACAMTCSDDWVNVLSLSRLAIHPEVPQNGASFLISKAIKLLPRRFHTLVTFADDFQNHNGTIYHATNWIYIGKTNPEPTYQIDGKMVARKSGPKTRTNQQMLDLGAVMVGRFSKHKFIYRRFGRSSL